MKAQKRFTVVAKVEARKVVENTAQNVTDFAKLKEKTCSNSCNFEEIVSLNKDALFHN